MNGPRHLSRGSFFVTEAQRTTAHRSSCDSNGTGGPWNADETACWRCEGCDSPLNKLRVGAPSNHPRAGRTQQLNRTGNPHPIRWAVSRRAGGPARSIISQGRGAHLADQSKIAGIRGRTCRQSQRTRIVFSTILRVKTTGRDRTARTERFRLSDQPRLAIRPRKQHQLQCHLRAETCT